ncbi:tripartite tricarboxylate transporter substrate binding protein [Siccirubricoccus sp. KC 17139]|uniref:Tripartite tricarboxylate transporter substrate binding protein n=1 Tax=Siccirubricoccus soli TaxID=2899147 RepID=A0ABT1D507_9PROT|nr:tripartite tricarboxylate transporter substrate binding protein [Siccirubricoccus soli]MCO6416998.1 tripartite tricarboxylate transporter substrate binding protein [Siccirubricoccus soli]MCP2683133.1 tripartite tricarboxylate transporter substrate binding protein [Siccirubricoccus soli]
MHHAWSRRALLGAAGVVGTGLAAPSLAQAGWPSRPVRLVVGFTPGSATDITGRIFAQRFAELWGQPVVVENIPGNGGAIGADRVAKAAPDGHTLLFGANGALTIVPSLQTLPFDPRKDLAAIGLVLTMGSLIFTNLDLPQKTLPEIIARAKAEPGSLVYGTPGVGTPQHIAGEMLCHQAGIRMEHIPYRGANLADVLNGVVPIGIQNTGAAMAMVRDGKLRCVAITSLQRSPTVPDVPTVAEQGFPGFEAISWFGLMGPAGTPPAVIERVNADARRVLADAEMQARFAQLGLDVLPGTPEAMREVIARDIPKWAKVIAEAGIATSR